MTAATQWRVVSEPISENAGGVNASGMSVALVNGETVKELGTVGWVRKDSVNPKKKFGDVLQERVAEAQKAADEVNRLETEKMAKAKEAFEPVRAELQAELDAAGELLTKLSGLDFGEIDRNRDAIEALAKMDFASIDAAREKINTLLPELRAEAETLNGAIEGLRKVDLFRLDKAKEMVDALQGLELATLEQRKQAVEPLAEQLEAQREAAGAAIAEYDDKVDEVIAKYVTDAKGKVL